MTAPRLILITGWGFRASALAPLKACLAQQWPDLKVQLEALPALTTDNASDWCEALEQRIGASDARGGPLWIGGWSLGGMLASRLVERTPQRFAGLITLASNARFSACSEWPQAMDAQIFDDFCARFRHTPQPTRQRFALLCSQGTRQRSLITALRSHLSDVSDAADEAGLQLLARLDNHTLLRRLAVPQLHFFAQHDALVPVSAATALRDLGNAQLNTATLAGSHAFPFEAPDALAARIASFIQQQEQHP